LCLVDAMSAEAVRAALTSTGVEPSLLEALTVSRAEAT
jgi:hypothetical protein